MKQRKMVTFIAGAMTFILTGCFNSSTSNDQAAQDKVKVSVEIANISPTSSGTTFLLAPGVWAASSAGNVLFTLGAAAADAGLEALAEDGNPQALAASLEAAGISHGTFGSAPLASGASYTFTAEIAPGENLYFATMYVQSNDLFYATSSTGLNIWDTMGHISGGDVTAEIGLWDAGTEKNEAPGVGEHQAPRQMAPNSGEHEMGVVGPVNDSFTYPATTDVIKVTITEIM